VPPTPVTLASLRQVAPSAASGSLRRTRNGVLQDAAAFRYLGPARWRVRYQREPPRPELFDPDVDWNPSFDE
jgi:hypothetical protein